MTVSPPVPGSPLLARLALAVSVPLLLLVIPELLLRAFWSPPEAAGQSVGTRRFVDWLEGLSIEAQDPGRLYREDDQLLWALQPGARIDTRNYHAASEAMAPPIHIGINEDGYRGPRAGPRLPGVRRVVCMGDSNFFGYPLDDADGFVSQLRAVLEERAPGGFEVLNGGVPGYTVVQGRRWYESRFAALEPDVLVISYLNNDAWRQPYTDSALLEQAAAPLAGPRRWLAGSFLVRALSSWLRPPPGEEDFVERVPLDRYRLEYEAMIDAARARGCRVVVTDFRAYAAYERYSVTLRKLCEPREVPVHEVQPAMQRALREGIEDPVHVALYERVRSRWGDRVLSMRPHLAFYAEMAPEHLNELGARVFAEQVAADLLLED